MYGLCLHATSKQFDPVLAPLFVGEIEAKDSLATKRFILRTGSGYKLSATKLVSFTGDEAEGATGRELGCIFVPCGPHRMMT